MALFDKKECLHIPVYSFISCTRFVLSVDFTRPEARVTVIPTLAIMLMSVKVFAESMNTGLWITKCLKSSDAKSSSPIKIMD
jgi:hypothetical protein